MNRIEYMKQLEEKLQGFDDDIVKEMLRDYEEHFEIGYAQNQSDSEIIGSLGSIDDLVKEMEQCYERHQNNRVYVDPTSIDSTIQDLKEGIQDSFQKGFTNYSFSSQDTPKDHEVQRFKFSKDIQRVFIDGFFGEIEVYKGNELYLDYECSGNKKAKFMAPLCPKVYDRELHISINDLPTFKGIMRHRPDMHMKLYVPKNIEILRFDNCLDTISIADVILGSLQIQVASSDVFVNDSRLEQCSIRTSSGDVEVLGCCSKKMNITVISGDITCRNSMFEKVEATSISGDITCEDGHVRMILAKSVSGDVVVECEDCEAYAITTTSGDVGVEVYRGAAIKVSTVSGDVEIALMEEANGFAASLSTKSGDIDISYETLEESELSSGVYQCSKSNKEINVKMQIDTMSGDINIHE